MRVKRKEQIKMSSGEGEREERNICSRPRLTDFVGIVSICLHYKLLSYPFPPTTSSSSFSPICICSMFSSLLFPTPVLVLAATSLSLSILIYSHHRASASAMGTLQIGHEALHCKSHRSMHAL